MLRYRPWAARLLISATRTVATSVQYTQVFFGLEEVNIYIGEVLSLDHGQKVFLFSI